VRTGARAAERVEVLAGLEAGEQVVTTGNFLLESESRVRGAIDRER
jgi:Cu(I)/Ag(I) efflux system membrane fusion protein